MKLDSTSNAIAPPHAVGELPVNAPAPSDDLPRQLMQMHQLRLENQRLKAVIDCFPLPLSVRDRQSRYTHVSQSWLNLHGFTHDDVIGHTWAQLKGSAISDLVLADEQLLTQVSLTKVERETESPTSKAETGILHKASLVENNVITGVITTITDISDRKVVERKLSSSEERFRSLASMSADWFWELDESLRFTHVTLGVEAATGQPTSFFIGRRLSELPEIVRTIRHNTQLTASLAQRQSFKDELVETAFSKEKRAWLSLSGEPMFNELGHFCGYRGVGRNVTDAHIANLRLLAEKEKADSANKVKTQFLANMSHELRTPLNGLMGMAELLSMTTLDAEQEEYVVALRQSADSLLNSVSNILLLTKLVGNSSNNTVAHFSCHDAVKTLADAAAQAAAAKHVFFKSNIDLPGAVLHIGNSEVMSKAVQCLLDNAVKFTERGNIHAHFALGVAANNIVMLEGTITDTGIGIDAKQLHTIFDVFEQADISNTRRFGGLGLGLPIAKRIFDQAGGALSVESIAGKGSSFKFSYPLRLN